MAGMKLFTIGFTRKSAEHFFTELSRAYVQRVLDIRLNNVFQLAGFAKQDDLRFFLKAICGIDYLHLPPSSPPVKSSLMHTAKTVATGPPTEAGF